MTVAILLMLCTTSCAAPPAAQTRPAESPAPIEQVRAAPIENLDLLIGGLYMDEDLRARAVDGLAKMGTEAIPRLRALVNSKEPSVVRYAAADAWARIDAKSDISTDELDFRFRTGVPAERTEAVAALRYRYHGALFEPVVEFERERNRGLDHTVILQHGTPAEQIDALEWVVRHGWRVPDIAPHVRALLDAPSAEVCQAAAEALESLEGLASEATYQLLDAAKSHDGYTRRLAIEVLARSGSRFHDKHVRKALQAALHDPSWLIRWPAAQGLIEWWEDFHEDFTAAMKAGDDTVTKVVMDDLLRPSSYILNSVSDMHRKAVQDGKPDPSKTPDMMAFADQVVSELLRYVQTDEQGDRAIAAIQILPLEKARPQAAEILKNALANSSSGMRLYAAKSLQRLWPQSLPAIVEGTRAADPQVRQICVDFLINQSDSKRDPAIDAALTAAITDPSESIRQLALLWAGKLSYAPDGIARRLAELTIPSSPVYTKNVLERTHVVQLLGQFAVDPKSSIPALSFALDEKERTVHLAAIVALRSFGADASPTLPRLLQLLHESNIPSYQEQIANTLLAIGPEGRRAAAPYFIDRMRQPMEKDTLLATIRALARIGPESAAAVPALENLLLEVDNDVRIEAAGALGEIGPASAPAIPALTRMVDNRRLEIREAATQSLIKISPDGKKLGPALLAAVYNGDRSCAARLAAAMRRAGADRAIVQRLDTLASEDPDAAVRAAARHAAAFLSAIPSKSQTTQPKR